jgi:hypothetical protein
MSESYPYDAKAERLATHTGAGAGANSCAQREAAHSVLKREAQRLREQSEHWHHEAFRLHQEAERLEALASVTAVLTGPAEEALWRIAVDSINRGIPRAF